MNIPDTVIETERLALVRFTRGDAEFIVALLNEPSFIQNIGDRGVRNVSDAIRYLETGAIASYERNGFGLLRVVLKESGESIGMCGLIKRPVLDDVDIGYAFLPKFWGQGYATEAAQGTVQFGRDVIRLKRLVAIVDPANTPSVQVLEKIGMQFERMVQLSADDIELKLFGMEL